MMERDGSGGWAGSPSFLFNFRNNGHWTRFYTHTLSHMCTHERPAEGARGPVGGERSAMENEPCVWNEREEGMDGMSAGPRPFRNPRPRTTTAPRARRGSPLFKGKRRHVFPIHDTTSP